MVTTRKAVRSSLLIREVNERINELSVSWPNDEPREFLCECGDEGCIEAILVTRTDYEAAREQSGRHVVTSDHRDETGVSVLMTRGGYSIVEYRRTLTDPRVFGHGAPGMRLS
jgi:hypothetical protein